MMNIDIDVCHVTEDRIADMACEIIVALCQDASDTCCSQMTTQMWDEDYDEGFDIACSFITPDFVIDHRLL